METGPGTAPGQVQLTTISNKSIGLHRMSERVNGGVKEAWRSNDPPKRTLCSCIDAAVNLSMCAHPLGAHAVCKACRLQGLG